MFLDTARMGVLIVIILLNLFWSPQTPEGKIIMFISNAANTKIDWYGFDMLTQFWLNFFHLVEMGRRMGYFTPLTQQSCRN